MLALPVYSYSLVTAQQQDALLPLWLSLCSSPRAPSQSARFAGRWHRWRLPASGSCLWGDPCGGGVLSSFGKAAGKGSTGFGLGVAHNEGGRKEEAGPLASSPGPKSEPATLTILTVPCSLSSAASRTSPLGCPRGGMIVPALLTSKVRHGVAVSLLRSHAGSQPHHGKRAFQHSPSKTCCSVLILQDWLYIKHSECTSGGLSSSPLTHLQQHQKYAAVAWKQFRSDTALIRGFRHLL